MASTDMVPEDRPPECSHTTQNVVDDAFLALRNRKRRYVCYFLLEHETASLSELADVVSAWIHTADSRVVEPRCRDQCHLQLLHVHVPTLVETNLLAYDRDGKTVSLAPCPEPVRELIVRACRTETGSCS